MCNEAARRISLGQIREDWSQLKIPLVFPEGLPNLQAIDSFRITDTTLILRAARSGDDRSSADAAEAPAAEGVMRRWSWPGPAGKPVYNYRSDGREFHNSPTQGRCLIAADAFYEFTDPARRADLPPCPGLADRPVAKGKKDKWSFTKPGAHGDEAWFGIAGLWRSHPDVGEAFTMLTTEPGPDIAPYHSRQIVILERRDWWRWLLGEAPAADVCRPLPAGSLVAELVAR